MKQIAIILLATLTLLQPFSKIWIYVSFKINQDRIAKTLCVQKEIKNNCCKGKCHLERELKKEDEKHQKQIPPSMKDKSEVLYFQNFSKNILLNAQLNSSKEKLIGFYHVSYSSSYINEVFKPPRLI